MANYETRLRQAKRDSTLQALFKCARLLNEHALTAYPKPELLKVARPAHMALFPHIALEHGTRTTELAARLGITKQAVGQLVDDLTRAGVVSRERDPEDGRAKRVVFTEEGRQAMLAGLRHLKDLEKQLTRELGQDVMQPLKASLLKILDHLEGR